MAFEELEAILNRIPQPLKNRITVDFDPEKQSFRLSTVIYSARAAIPGTLEKYIKAREGMAFRPHKTSFTIEESKVHHVQELPFHWGFQPTLRGHTVAFWRLAKHCHQMVSEIASE